MKRDISLMGYILIAFTVGVILKIYFESDAFNLKCIISDVDGKKYCVRERGKMTLVVDLLAKTTTKVILPRSLTQYFLPSTSDIIHFKLNASDSK
jgi:hypothetical protein